MMTDFWCPRRQTRRSCAAALLTFGLTLALLGCDRGPKLFPAGGTVTYKGKPLAGADVVLVPEDGSLPAIGRTDDAGRFTVTTGGRPGALAGSYQVAVTAVRQKRAVSDAEAVAMTSAQIAANHESLIPAKYNHMSTSGLTCKVSDDPAANDFAFQLE